jgi:ABC-type multidrug transport system ATPase subunit
MQARRALGYVPDRPILYDTLTGREFLSYVAQLHAIPGDTAAATIDRLIAALDFGPHADAYCRTYSFGTRSKIALAAALLHDPPVLVLDEPFNGLDPLSAHDVRAMLAERANAGTTILLSTHDLAIAETLCDRIGILANGRLVAEGNLDTLTEGGTIPLDVRFRTLTRAARAVPAGAR